MARLSLAAVAPPAFVGSNSLRGVCQVRTDRCVAREELEVSTSDSLVLPLGALPDFSTFGGAVSPFGPDVPSDPVLRALRLGLSGVRPKSERGRLPMIGATLESWHSRAMRAVVEGV